MPAPRLVRTATALTVSAGVLCATIPAALAASPVDAAAPVSARGGPAWLPEIAASDRLSTPVVVQGRVVGRRAGAAAPGTQVVLLAWPSEDVLSRLEVGDSVKLVPVAKDTVDSSGRYVLRAPSGKALGHLASARGQIDLEVLVSGGEGSSVHAFSRQLANPGSDDAAQLSAVAPAPGAADGAVVADLALAGGDAEVDGSAEAPAVIDKVCTSEVTASYPTQRVHVGQTYVATSGGSADFVYTSGANSSLGVGSNISGVWKSSGTASRSSTSSWNFPAQSAYTYKYYDSYFTYKRFRVTCISGNGYNGIYSEVRPTAFDGGTSVRSLSAAPTANYCVPFAAGSSYSGESTTAINWTNGVDISAKIGIDLSVTTGYSSAARQTYKTTGSRRLCGTANTPGNSPRQVVLKS